jgi:hypothetical protein
MARPAPGRGRPPHPPVEDAVIEPPPSPPPLTPLERRGFDYTGLDAAMASADAAMRAALLGTVGRTATTRSPLVATPTIIGFSHGGDLNVPLLIRS